MVLTQSWVAPSLVSQRLLSLASLFQVWVASDGLKAQLLVDEEREDSQQDNEDPYGRQEADGFGSDWRENTAERRKHHHYHNYATSAPHN